MREPRRRKLRDLERRAKTEIVAMMKKKRKTKKRMKRIKMMDREGKKLNGKKRREKGTIEEEKESR